MSHALFSATREAQSLGAHGHNIGERRGSFMVPGQEVISRIVCMNTWIARRGGNLILTPSFVFQSYPLDAPYVPITNVFNITQTL